MNKKLVLLGFGVLLLAGGCRSNRNETPEEAARRREDARVFAQNVIAESTAKKLDVGERTKITLSENPTTGYRWVITRMDTRRLKLVSNTYDAPDTKMVGVPGKRIIVVEAIAPGSTGLKLALKRSWEKDAKPKQERSFRYRVVE